MTSASSGSSGTISVPGRGVVAVDPDVALIRLGVVIVRPSAAAARTAAAATMQAVLGALADGGVQQRDLRTTLVGLDAVRDFASESGQTITGYQLTNAVEATIRAIAAEARVELGGVVAIVEGGVLEPGPPRPMAELRMNALADTGTPVEAGTSEIEVSVSVTFAIA